MYKRHDRSDRGSNIADDMTFITHFVLNSYFF